MTRLAGIVALTAVYALALGSADPADLALGAALAVALVAWLPGRAKPAPAGPATLLRLLPIALSTLVGTATGTGKVLLTVLGVRNAEPGLVEVPVEGSTGASIALAASAISLTPGEVVVDADPDRDVMTVHLLDARDPDAARRRCGDVHDRCREALAG